VRLIIQSELGSKGGGGNKVDILQGTHTWSNFGKPQETLITGDSLPNEFQTR